MRAVVLGSDAASPTRGDRRAGRRPASSFDVLACGLCGSDVEKIGVAAAGNGARARGRGDDRRRAARRARPPRGLRRVRSCLAGHESTCEQFPEPTIVPAASPSAFARSGVGRASRRRSTTPLGTYVEPLACVLRGAERVPRGRVLVVGQRLHRPALRRRAASTAATRCSRSTGDPRRAGPRARRPGRRGRALGAGGVETRPRRASAGRHDARSSPTPARSRPPGIYRRRADGDRRRARRRRHTWSEAVALLPALDAARRRPSCRSSASARGSLSSAP